MGQDPSSSLLIHHTPLRDLITIHCTQTSIFQDKTEFYPLFSCLRSIESRRKGFKPAYFPSKEHLTDVRMRKTVAMVENSTSCVKPGAMGGVCPFVMNCNCQKVWPVVSVAFSLWFAQEIVLSYVEILRPSLGRTQKEMKTSSQTTVWINSNVSINSRKAFDFYELQKFTLQ